MATLLHTDTPIVVPDAPSGPTSVLEGFTSGDSVGNPLYTVIDEHVIAAVLLVLAPGFMWLGAKWIRRMAARRDGWARSLVEAHDGAPMRRRVAAWAVALSSVLHLALVFGHDLDRYTALYLSGAVVLGLAANWILRGTRSTLAVLTILGSIVAFWFLGAPADQLGLVTKLLELFGLALLALPTGETSLRRRLAPAGVVTMVVLTGIAAWIGAFATVGADGGHHGGEFPDPGTVVPYIETLEATDAEFAYSEDLYWRTVAAVQKYQDPAVAEAAGYHVGTIVGSDHHAQNPDLIGDGRILDPEYPESLIYGVTGHGPRLVGVMFEMDGIGDVGPRDAGPIIVWHGHDNVCFGFAPFGLAGLESPFGGCPIGSVNIPLTGEMLHMWTMPGVPVEDHWGHVEEEWLDSYLSDDQRHHSDHVVPDQYMRYFVEDAEMSHAHEAETQHDLAES